MVYWLRPVLVPFVVALFVVSGITPVLETVERFLKVNRLVASVIAFVCGLFLLVLLSFCLWGSVQQLALQGQAYRARVIELLGSAQKWTPKGLLPVATPRKQVDAPSNESSSNDSSSNDSSSDGESSEVNPESLPESVPNVTAQDDSADSDAAQNETQIGSDANGVIDQDVIDQDVIDQGDISDDLDQPPGLSQVGNDLESSDGESFRGIIDRTIRQGVAHVSASLLEVFSTSIVVLIYVFFLLLGSADSTKVSGSIQAVNQQVQSYLFLKTVISIVTGAAFGGALWLFGVPMSLTFGLLAFLLNFIPNVGPVVASILPIPFILLSPEGSVWWMLAAISVTMAIQVISGSVVEPKMMGDTSDMHPVVILLALMFWGMMWGITGMFLATPITAGIKIVLEGNPTTKPIADIMAGRFEKLTGAGKELA